MITRPLDVSTRLRPPPRSFDYLYWINGALLALFFVFFGSRFVLSPGMGIGPAEKILPSSSEAASGVVATQIRLEVAESKRLWVDTGLISREDLPAWLAKQGKAYPGATLLVQFDVSNPADLLVEIFSEATGAGLHVQLAATNRPQAVDTREHRSR